MPVITRAMARSMRRGHTVHIDLLRACAMLCPLCLGAWMPLPATAWTVPAIWAFVLTHVPGLPLIRALPHNPAWWVPVWWSVVIISRATLVQAAAIFQLEGVSIARSLLVLHAWSSMVYMMAFVWFSYVASQHSVPIVPMVPDARRVLFFY